MATKTDALSDDLMEELEAQVPLIAASATRAAYNRAVASGRTLVKLEGAFIVLSGPDGSKQVLSHAKPRRKVTIGQVFETRSPHVGR